MFFYIPYRGHIPKQGETFWDFCRIQIGVNVDCKDVFPSLIVSHIPFLESHPPQKTEKKQGGFVGPWLRRSRGNGWWRTQLGCLDLGTANTKQWQRSVVYQPSNWCFWLCFGIENNRKGIGKDQMAKTWTMLDEFMPCCKTCFLHILWMSWNWIVLQKATKSSSMVNLILENTTATLQKPCWLFLDCLRCRPKVSTPYKVGPD